VTISSLKERLRSSCPTSIPLSAPIASSHATRKRWCGSFTRLDCSRKGRSPAGRRIQTAYANPRKRRKAKARWTDLPARRAAETRRFGTTKKEGLALENTLRLAGELGMLDGTAEQIIDSTFISFEANTEILFERFQRAPAREDGKPAKDRLLLGRQEVIAPADRVAHGPLTRRKIARPTGEQAEAVVKVVAQRRQRNVFDARSG